MAVRTMMVGGDCKEIKGKMMVPRMEEEKR